MQKVKVFSPGSIGNMGSGFDVFGLAIEGIGDIIEVAENDAGQHRILAQKGDDSISNNPNKNIVTIAAQALLTHLGLDKYFDFIISKGVKAGSGLGSSGSSATAGVFAINQLIDQPLTKLELLPFAGIGEQVASPKAHYDNVAASMLGGMTVIHNIKPLEVLSVPVPKQLTLVLARPGMVINTAEAKKILGDSMPITNAIKQFGNIAGMVIGMQTNNIDLIGRSVEDEFATPVRSKLIPKFEAARTAALNAGAAGFNISGSGPSMFAVCAGNAIAEKVAAAIKEVYQDDAEADFYITRADTLGTRVIE